MIIFNIISAEIKTKSADVLLKMITILKELSIVIKMDRLYNNKKEIGRSDNHWEKGGVVTSAGPKRPKSSGQVFFI